MKLIIHDWEYKEHAEFSQIGNGEFEAKATKKFNITEKFPIAGFRIVVDKIEELKTASRYIFLRAMNYLEQTVYPTF